jgi:hypothetical protein
MIFASVVRRAGALVLSESDLNTGISKGQDHA